MASPHSRDIFADRPSRRHRAPSVLVKPDEQRVFVDGREFQLRAESKTAWLVVDVQTGWTSWFRLCADPAGGYVVREAADRSAESIGAAWIWGCGQTSRSPLPPRPSLH
jgi:hypothetical protein